MWSASQNDSWLGSSCDGDREFSPGSYAEALSSSSWSGGWSGGVDKDQQDNSAFAFFAAPSSSASTGSGYEADVESQCGGGSTFGVKWRGHSSSSSSSGTSSSSSRCPESSSSSGNSSALSPLFDTSESSCSNSWWNHTPGSLTEDEWFDKMSPQPCYEMMRLFPREASSDDVSANDDRRPHHPNNPPAPWPAARNGQSGSSQNSDPLYISDSSSFGSA